MSHHEPNVRPDHRPEHETSPVARRTRSGLLAVLALACALLAGVLAGCQPSIQTGAPTSADAPPMGQPRASGRTSLVLGHRDEQWADGSVPSGVTVFDEQYPAVANLDPDLLAALRKAASAAIDDAVELHVNSGWRSEAHQDHLLSKAIDEYGSAEEAARWVATPETSPHVSGDAVDIGGHGSTAWLSAHGAGYGLCQIYDNEPWHYELRPDAVDDGCPTTYADPTRDPRMQQ
jgi:D-alanyl-D-alanine carboxypeptidase